MHAFRSQGPWPIAHSLPSGSLVAASLVGAWRRSPPRLDLPLALFSRVVPLLVAGGCGGLVWWRVRGSSLAEAPEAAPLREQYRAEALQAALHEIEIKRYVGALRKAGIRALLGKGWAVARSYPGWGLRPCGDVDLYVSPSQYQAAREALHQVSPLGRPVDLHRGIFDLEDREMEEVTRRAQRVLLGGEEVFVFGPEDHLRLLCLHGLRHGLSRPVWLCDVALGLESAGGAFDWEYFFWGDTLRARWLSCALWLASRLLGAGPLPWLAGRFLPKPPGWLLKEVLGQWGRPYHVRIPLSEAWRRPRGFWREVLHHWPNTIEAMMGVGGDLCSPLPGFSFQIANSWQRAGQLAARLLRGPSPEG